MQKTDLPFVVDVHIWPVGSATANDTVEHIPRVDRQKMSHTVGGTYPMYLKNWVEF